MFTATLLFALAGCDRSGLGLMPQVSDAPYLDDLGELTVVPRSEWGIFDPDGDDCDSTFKGRENDKVVYTEIGVHPDPSVIGGSIATFRGTGGPVCVVVDPEAVSWIQDIQTTGVNNARYYADRITDDADIDVAVGLSAYYTGSPGVSMGDFVATLTDEVGGVHELAFQECFPWGSSLHAGRAITEYCTIDTAERFGVSYTVQMKSFAVPIDDSVTQYAVGVFDGDCSDVIGGANIDATNPDNSFCGIAHGADAECALEGEGVRDDDESFLELEEAYCGAPKDLKQYCEDHLEDDDAPCSLGYLEDHPAPSGDDTGATTTSE